MRLTSHVRFGGGPLEKGLVTGTSLAAYPTARRVRRAARRNGPVATPAPRSVPTQQKGRSAAIRSIGSRVPSRITNALVRAMCITSARVGARPASTSTASRM